PKRTPRATVLPGEAACGRSSTATPAGVYQRRGMRLRTVLVVAAPIVSVATLMIGLRVGAEDAVRAAVVMGAPPARALPDGTTALAWQLLTLVHDRGVRETIPIDGLT